MTPGLATLMQEGVRLEDAPDLHAQIMNLQAKSPISMGDKYRGAFNHGHREARHAAAELASAQEASHAAMKKLAAFGAWCALEFRRELADVDGGSAQDAMERFGVIERKEVTEPCGEECVCAGYGAFPHDCYTFASDVSEFLDRTAPQRD